jgi:hypothetical protein
LKLNERRNRFEGFETEHNWTHKCRLWDLSYVQALILMHNIDIMHQEQNIGECLISTCLDNPMSRKDLALICSQPPLELGEREKKPCAPYSLKPKKKKELMRWMKNLMFPEGYSVGFRRFVNVKADKFFGLKCHDYHIVMENSCAPWCNGRSMV